MQDEKRPAKKINLVIELGNDLENQEEPSMLREFEKRYVALWSELQHQQWCNYFEEQHHDLSLLDEKLYKLVQSYADVMETSQRKGQVAASIIRRELVDKDPVVSKLRNFIDDLDNYKQDIPKEIQKDTYRHKLEIAKRMKPDVLRLMDMRNSLAIKQGYKSYVDLVFATEEIDKEKLIALLNDYLDENLVKARKLIKKYDISFDSWFADLHRIS